MKHDKIEKHIDIAAPLGKVWQALTDHRQFGEWFGVTLEGPFIAGKTVRGSITIEGYEGVPFTAHVKLIEPETRFSYTWHPCCKNNEAAADEEPTLVEITLERIDTGTRVSVVESGFSRLPAHRYEDAYRGNSDGWVFQLERIARYVAPPLGQSA